MKPAAFALERPSVAADAIARLASDPGARALAGGQSLVPMLNLRLAPVDTLVDLGRVADLRGTERLASGARYGALTTHAAFEDGLVPDVTNGLMRHVAGTIAFRAVRTRGTIGGAIALADPAADWLTTVIALEGILHVRGPQGDRRVDAAAFVLGPYYTALAEGELIVAVEIRARPPGERWGHYKVVLKTGEYAKSIAIALVEPSRRSARVVLGAIESPPLVLDATANAVRGGVRGEALGRIVRDELAAADRGFDDVRLHLHGTSVMRAIDRALAP